MCPCEPKDNVAYGGFTGPGPDALRLEKNRIAVSSLSDRILGSDGKNFAPRGTRLVNLELIRRNIMHLFSHYIPPFDQSSPVEMMGNPADDEVDARSELTGPTDGAPASLSDRSGYATAPTLPDEKKFDSAVLPSGSRPVDATARTSASSEKLKTDPESQKEAGALPVLISQLTNETKLAAIAGQKKSYGDLDFEGIDPDLIQKLIKEEGVRQGLSQRHLQLIALAGAIVSRALQSTPEKG